MALSNVIKNMRDGTLLIADGTYGTPIQINVSFDNGDFSISGLKAKLAETTAYESRGQLRSLRHTTRVYPTGSFSCMMAEFSEATTGTVADALLKNGAFSAAVSTKGADADVYCVSLSFVCDGTTHGDASDHSFTLNDCECSIDFAEGDPNSFTINFTVYGAISGGLAASE